MSEPIANVSGYYFVELLAEDLPLLKSQLLGRAKKLQLKGTILLSTEGINAFLAGPEETIDSYHDYLQSFPQFSALSFKKSYSEYQPFTRMLVRIKKEIISMGCDSVKPAEHTAPHISAKEFHQWYEEHKDMVVLDTRNDYEVSLGTFDDSINLDIKSFRAFPDKIKALPNEMKKKPVVTFCTGGIRCEKAAEYMLQEGFEEVYQLDGGILKYFEECGGDHYKGDCFVFDKRVAVDTNLKETTTQQCYACRSPILAEQQVASGQCPHCNGNALTGNRY